MKYDQIRKVKTNFFGLLFLVSSQKLKGATMKSILNFVIFFPCQMSNNDRKQRRLRLSPDGRNREWRKFIQRTIQGLIAKKKDKNEKKMKDNKRKNSKEKR